MKVKVLTAAIVSVALTGPSWATNCSASVVDCNGVTISASWVCETCDGVHSRKGMCESIIKRKDPNDPNSCIVSLSGKCAECVNQ